MNWAGCRMQQTELARLKLNYQFFTKAKVPTDETRPSLHPDPTPSTKQPTGSHYERS